MISKTRLRELAALRPDGHKVLSVYLNLDPSEFPTPRDRKTEFDSLLDAADQGTTSDHGLSHDQRMELRRDLERVRDWYERSFDASGARGLAMFVAGGAGLFEVHKLARPIESEVVIDDSPFIEPLTKLPGGDGYCVYLVNRRTARILVGGADGLREVLAFVDDVHKWHKQGGWSQARYQRGIAKEAHDHLKRAADELFKLFKRGLVRRLVVGTQPEAKGDIEASLHPYLRDRVAGWIDVDVKAAASQVAEQAKSLILEDEEQREQHWLDRLQSELGRDSRGARGLDGVLAVLNEKRVEALLVCSGFRAPGYATPSADFLATTPGVSATGERLEARDDVIESALERALEQSAEVIVIRHRPEPLEALGSIGAVLRF